MNNNDEKMKNMWKANAGANVSSAGTKPANAGYANANHASASAKPADASSNYANTDARNATENTGYSLIADDGGIGTDLVEICIACARYAETANEFIKLIKSLKRVVGEVSKTPYSDVDYLTNAAIAIGLVKNKDGWCKK